MVAFQEPSKTTFCVILMFFGAPLGVSLATVSTIFSGCDSGCVRGIRVNPSKGVCRPLKEITRIVKRYVSIYIYKWGYPGDPTKSE